MLTAVKTLQFRKNALNCVMVQNNSEHGFVV